MGTIARDGLSRNTPVWAKDEMRLDPYAMPQNFDYTADDNRVSIALDHRGAVMKRALSCGLPLSICLPSRAFEGVAARSFEHEDGTLTMTLELKHRDAALSVPLCVSDDAEETACDWHSWARALGLPMLLIEADGSVTKVKDGGLMVADIPASRRRRVSGTRRRPRFLQRRRKGIVGEVRRVTGDEIIARN